MTDAELDRFASFYGASWPNQRWKADTRKAAALWLRSMTLGEAMTALQALVEEPGRQLQFAPTVPEIRQRHEQLRSTPSYLQLAAVNSDDWPPEIPPPDINNEIPEDLQYLYPAAKREATGTDPNRHTRQT